MVGLKPDESKHLLFFRISFKRGVFTRRPVWVHTFTCACPAGFVCLHYFPLHIYLQKLDTWLHFNIHRPQAVWYISSQHLSSFRADTNGSFLPLQPQKASFTSTATVWSPANKIFPAVNPALIKKEVLFVSLTRSLQRTALPPTSPQGLLIIGECRITLVKRRCFQMNPSPQSSQTVC